ncbi:MAG: hypothetical protein H0W89_07140 [Candidatus Levybacteria bacterium]|nr:hypothetical protein [Candidatus Levybacteria bacterium]
MNDFVAHWYYPENIFLIGISAVLIWWLLNILGGNADNPNFFLSRTGDKRKVVKIVTILLCTFSSIIIISVLSSNGERQVEESLWAGFTIIASITGYRHYASQFKTSKSAKQRRK